MTLVTVAVCFTAGVYLSESIGVYFVLLFTASVFVTSFIVCLRRKCNASIPLAALIFCAGVIGGKASVTDEFNKARTYTNHYVTVEGRICELPQHSGEIYRYIVDIRRLFSYDGEQKIRGKLLITSDEELEYGETALFSGFIREFPEELNENGFDVSRYYKIRRIAYRMNALDAQICDQKIHSYTPYALMNSFRYSISRLIDNYYNDDDAAVLKAVIVGDRCSFSEDFKRVLNKTGAKRLFYPAFLHVTLIGLFVGIFSNFIGKRKRDVIMVSFLIIYALLNCNQYSCLKSAIIAAGVILSKRRYGMVYIPDVIAAAALIIGVSNPASLTDSGLVMSVTATISTRLFYPQIVKICPGRGGLFRRMLLIYVAGAVSLIPLQACYFGNVSLYVFAAQLLIIPLAAGIIILSPILLILLKLFGNAWVVGWLINTIVYIITLIPKIIDKQYLSSIPLPAFPPGMLLAYYLALCAVYMSLKKRYIQRTVCVLAAAGLVLGFGISQLLRTGGAEFNFVNVGQGDGALIEMPFQSSIIIDGGGSGAYSDYDLGENVFVPFLQSKGVFVIDTAFVSHYHKDHAQGIVAAINNLKVKNVFLPDTMEDSEWRVRLEDAADKNGTKIWYISDDTRITYKNGLVIDIAVPKGIYELSGDENDTSLLMNVSYGDFNCLFTGDMTKTEEKYLLSAGKVSNADMLKVAHHGSDSSSSEEMISAVSPEISIIGVGRDNEYGLPSDFVLDRLKSSMIYRTDRNGNIKVTVRKNGVREIEIYKGEFGYGAETGQ